MGLGLGIRTRARRLLQRLSRWQRQRPRRPLVRQKAERLHIGSGPQTFSGWVNIDLEMHPGVDLVHDVRDGLAFQDVRYIYAEHFIEHLTYDEGLRFFRECRTALRDDGILRISTPNLDWVMATQYITPDAITNCFAMNKAFRGWGHRFLYNAATLEATLHAAGFASVRFFGYGESGDPLLSGLERHPTSPDSAETPHVIIAEATGRGGSGTPALDVPASDYDQALHS